ncbi:uracil-DNA glycosylase [Hyphomicrobium facile]|uniref:Type-5 uracil-DNA glycosylase n=1 Tax=Hyphomicrobium facile TaxID=51670 RepID=A0A1I7N1P7_9HYPH|nr:uracil-DNA glycosylase [Hyphomicrobium facile]SFV28591.1 uracil-DNA glycosylase, family 4 [Hyphomicrobium facile]
MAPGAMGKIVFGPEPPAKCTRCPRLVAYRKENENQEPDWFNGAVPSFGTSQARLLIVGLAPGRNGANRTGRPFTGDYAGDLLYQTLLEFGFAKGEYRASPDDGLKLIDCMITNAVRCVPPLNKPEPSEIANCRPFFEARLANLPKLKVILALGRIAHDQTLATLEKRKTLHPFAHGARHELSPDRVLYDSFHCSRYNTNTRRLTTEMFRSVFAEIRRELA